MKPLLLIHAELEQPELMQNLVEQLAYRRYEIGYGKMPVPAGWKALETSSTEVYVSGTLDMEQEGWETIHMPFITCFLFTCIRGEREPYQLIWSHSFN